MGVLCLGKIALPFHQEHIMIRGLIGEKIEMSQVFDKRGRVVPITKIKVQPNFIVQIKGDKDAYKAAQLGVGARKKANKPLAGRAKKAGLEKNPKIFREVNFEGDLKPGEKITAGQVFRKGSLVDVVGLSKGKGFAGVVKRWGFAGGPRTHGQSDRERAPGSIGASTTPGRVLKGLKMAGRMGGDQVTIQGLEVVDLLEDESEIWVKGSIPGSRGTYVLIEKSKKRKKAYHEPEISGTPQMPSIKEKGKDEEEAPTGEEVKNEQEGHQEISKEE
jgi:large subunit ribosomal protein L3